MSLEHKFLPQSEFDTYADFFANFRFDPPPRFNFGYDVVAEYAKTEPNRRAFVWADDDGTMRTFTFADMDDLSDRAASVLASHGIRRGDAVMLTLKNRWEFWMCIVACHKLGAVAVPATHMLMVHDLVYRFTRANIRMVVTAPDARLAADVDAACDTLPAGHSAPVRASVGGAALRPGWADFDAEVAAAPRLPEPPPDSRPGGRDPMLAYFSSGTTGEPKMVLHDYYYALAHVITAKYWHRVEDGGLHYTVADTGWGKAVWGNLYGQWTCGCATFVHDYVRFNAARTLELSAKAGITSFCAPPTVYRFLAKEDLSQYDFSRLKHAAVAGEPLNPEVYERFLEATGLPLMECYGQTETTVVVGNFLDMVPRPGSMGKPSPLYRPVLLTPDGRECEIGEHGEMCIPLPSKDLSPEEQLAQRPLGLFREYLGDPEATARAERLGVYHTGDVAWRDEDGYFWYVGRDDDLIKSSGYRIGPFEVESALMEHPAVLECAVTGAPDPDRGQIVKATVVLTKDYAHLADDPATSAALVKELQDHVKHATAPYKYPRAVVFVPELPKTISGKIKRNEIRKQDHTPHA